uniref:NAD-dependent epimerase/dehydratase domain-containing protein n=1 Tax=Chromera velia CCMP2878 TaxID=1169474 RepID=A0A0G4G1Q5_9ALVE|eukprot:Cvel_19843.t1-p1 / transcript=Cvel_19843.t1 / gene=Cvel_19843 / organism=Chromera_velia_CCMP2878 / gene_product=hypothetical protein / transcript_product=hypothetical protein / location=Cvel_scaffold1737:23840-28834(-) / protein_length=701 / sequence_SO=supercontig / SO=protein_coding / is_pseudo=false
MSLPLSTKGPPVLVLGGSTFVGRALVDALIARGFSVTVANRGREYWGTKDPSEGRAQRIRVNRDRREEFSSALRAATPPGPVGWFAVVDFCAYKPADLQCALEGLQKRFFLYVLISTDSVYEVCEGVGSSRPPGMGVTEEDARRPQNPERVKCLKKKDKYGHEKLECEELLQALACRWDMEEQEEAHALSQTQTHNWTVQAEKIKPHFVALRLADVLGPFDDTGRLFAYWWWLQFDDVEPLHIPREQEKERESNHGGGSSPGSPVSPKRSSLSSHTQQAAAAISRQSPLRTFSQPRIGMPSGSSAAQQPAFQLPPKRNSDGAVVPIGDFGAAGRQQAGVQRVNYTFSNDVVAFICALFDRFSSVHIEGKLPSFLSDWGRFEAFNVASEEALTLGQLIDKMGAIMRPPLPPRAASSTGSSGSPTTLRRPLPSSTVVSRMQEDGSSPHRRDAQSPPNGRRDSFPGKPPEGAQSPSGSCGGSPKTVAASTDPVYGGGESTRAKRESVTSMRGPPNGSIPSSPSLTSLSRGQPVCPLQFRKPPRQGPPSVRLAKARDSCSFLPSVDRKEPLSTEKALRMVPGFRPSPMEAVLKSCCEFFARASQDFPEETISAISKLPRCLRGKVRTAWERRRRPGHGRGRGGGGSPQYARAVKKKRYGGKDGGLSSESLSESSSYSYSSFSSSSSSSDSGSEDESSEASSSSED